MEETFLNSLVNVFRFYKESRHYIIPVKLKLSRTRFDFSQKVENFEFKWKKFKLEFYVNNMSCLIIGVLLEENPF